MSICVRLSGRSAPFADRHYIYSDASCCVITNKRKYAVQHTTLISYHNATCFSLHEPSLGISFYDSLKTGIFENAINVHACSSISTGWRTKCHTIDCAHNTFLLLQKHLTSGTELIFIGLKIFPNEEHVQCDHRFASKALANKPLHSSQIFDISLQKVSESAFWRLVSKSCDECKGLFARGF